MEEPILVVDMGSSSIKAGFSGEDTPSYVIPSFLSKNVNKNLESIEAVSFENSATPTLNTNTSHPIYRGAIKDWDHMEKLWQMLADQMNIAMTDNISVMLVESPLSTFADRSKWTEMLFDVFRVSSICIGNSASLTVFASGRTSGLAVECGAGVTATTPIFEGLALKHAAVCTDFAGQDISYNLKKLFHDKHIELDLASAKIVKEQLAFVTNNNIKKPERTTFCLPDGNDVTVDTKLLSQCAESVFVNNKLSTGGLPNQVFQSIVLCDDSVKKELASNIIISGGTSMLPGFGDRLNVELIKKFTAIPDYKHIPLNQNTIKVIPSSNYNERGYTLQRKHAAWIGGSLIGSFDTYHKNLKISRQEWEENPDAVVNIKSF